MPNLMILYMAFIKTFVFELNKSSLCEGSINIVSEKDMPSFLIITFPTIVFPHIRNFDNIIAMKETKDKELHVIFYFTKRFSFILYYEKLILPITEYDWNAERGFYFKPAYLIQEKNIYESKPVFDIYYVPDFTVPFLAYNTSGCIFSFIFGLIIKQQILKNKIKNQS